MKRIYIAFAFIIFSLIVGIIEFNTLNSSVDKCKDSLKKIESLVKDDNVKKAEKLLKNTSDNFENYSKNYLYCYYRHDELDDIADRLYNLEDLLDDKRIDDFHEKSHETYKKLLYLKEKEPVTIQNIL